MINMRTGFSMKPFVCNLGLMLEMQKSISGMQLQMVLERRGMPTTTIANMDTASEMKLG